ncbi:MAG: hypothetical protein ABI193_14080, partial [Minicystis sp.]
MNFAAARNHAAPALFLAMLLGLPLSSSACGRTACFSWSVAEGACPAQKNALRFFSDPRCPANVVSVDSEGSSDFEGRLCCYDVTQNDVHFNEGFDTTNCGVSPSTGTAPNAQGAGGFGSGSAVSVTAVSVGEGTGGSTGCVRCAEALSSPLPPDAVLCPGSKELFFQLSDCTCNGPCTAACGDNACSG